MYDGQVGEGLSVYGKLSRRQAADARSAGVGPLAKIATVKVFTVNGSDDLVQTVVEPGGPIHLILRGELERPLRKFRTTLCIFKGDQLVLGLHDAVEPSDAPAGAFESAFSIPAFFLSPGEYSVDINMYSNERGDWMLAKGFCLFSVATRWHPLYEPTHAMGVVNLNQCGQRRYLA
jgi:hypothetical protein